MMEIVDVVFEEIQQSIQIKRNNFFERNSWKSNLFIM